MAANELENYKVKKDQNIFRGKKIDLIGKYGIDFKRVTGNSARLVWGPYFRKL